MVKFRAVKNGATDITSNYRKVQPDNGRKVSTLCTNPCYFRLYFSRIDQP